MSDPTTQSIIDFLATNFGVQRAEIGLDRNLVEDAILDSAGIFELVGFLEDEFAIAVADEDTVVETFETVAKIVDYVARAKGVAPQGSARVQAAAPVERIHDPALRIVTERFYMRALGEADCTERYLGWLNDVEVNRYSRRRDRVYGHDDFVAYVREANAADDKLLVGVFVKDADQHVGNILMSPINWTDGTAEMSNLIGEPTWWGKGVAVEAGKHLIHYCFRELGLRKIYLGNLAPNRAATFKSSQLGFKPEAKFRQHVLWNDQYVDVLWFGMLEQEFYQRFPEFAGADG